MDILFYNLHQPRRPLSQISQGQVHPSQLQLYHQKQDIYTRIPFRTDLFVPSFLVRLQ